MPTPKQDLVAEAVRRLREVGPTGSLVTAVSQADGGVIVVVVDDKATDLDIAHIRAKLEPLRCRIERRRDDGTGYRVRHPPHRIQLSRRSGWRKPEGAVTVARPSKFGNPLRVGETGPDARRIETREQAVALFDAWIRDSAAGDRVRDAMLAALPELAGRDLACWCPLDGPCHADVLIELAN